MSDLLESAAPYVVRLHSGEDFQARVLAWFRRNGLDPLDIPWDAGLRIADDGSSLTTEVYSRNGKGGLVIEGDEAVRSVATFPLVEPPDTEIAEWIASATEPTARP